MRRRAKDARHAESLTIIAVALVFTAATLASQWSWILLGDAAPGNALSLWVFAAHVVGGALLGWTCLWGWKPPVVVEAGPEEIVVSQGEETLKLGYEDIETTERVTADAYHRHWRRYAATRAFVNRLPGESLLLRTASGPVVLGLSSEDLADLEAYVTAALGMETVEPMVRAA